MTAHDRPRTVSPFGLSHLELPRLTEGMSYLRRQGVGVLLSAAPLPDEGLVRDLAREAKNRLALTQRRANMRRVLWLQVNEAVPSFHWHIAAPFPTLAHAQKVVASLNAAEAFLRHGPTTLDARLVHDWDGLTGYLAGEATPQAWYAAGKAFPRVPGSHTLGDGGGDRVLLSEAVEAVLIRTGKVEPRVRTYAARSLSRPTKTKRARALAAGEMQLPLFEHLAKPVARLGDFDSGIMPQSVAMEIRFLCRRKGLTLTALGERAAQSRQNIGNSLNGRFPISQWGVQRIREALAA